MLPDTCSCWAGFKGMLPRMPVAKPFITLLETRGEPHLLGLRLKTVPLRGSCLAGLGFCKLPSAELPATA